MSLGFVWFGNKIEWEESPDTDMSCMIIILHTWNVVLLPPPQKRARVLHSAIFLGPAILTIHPECALGSRSHWQSLPVSVSHTHPINVTECMFYRLSLKH